MKRRSAIYNYCTAIITIVFLWSNSVVSFGQMRSPLEEPFIPGHLIVQVKEGTDMEALVRQLPENHKFKINRLLANSMRAWLLEFDPTTLGQLEAIRMLYDLDEVTIAQNNHLVEIRSVEPNDPQFGNQWHHKNTGQGGGTAGADIKSTEAWEITTGGKNAFGDDIVVCILEQVNFNHDDLKNNQWVNTAEIPGNGIDDDGNGYIDDINGWNVGNNSGNLPTNNSGHGTNVAGMIGAIGDNSVGVAGANWDVKMMNIVGYNINSEASVVAAYEYPLVQRKIYNETNGQSGAFVVSTNASWGIDNANPNNFPIWCAFYDTLGKYGILNCGATSNSNVNVDVNGDMPTGCTSQYMVGIGRSDRNDNFAGGYGATTINFAAPGIDVRTTANNNGYTTTTGTSFASPLTAGVIALMYSIPCPNFMNIVMSNPQEGANLVYHALMDGTDEKPSLAGNFITGGRLNAKNSIDLLMEETCSPCAVPSDFSATVTGNHTADITFSENEDAISYNFYFREEGLTQWNSISSSSVSMNLSGLNQCTVYEAYLEVVCEYEISQPSQIITFKTEGCEGCDENEYCDVSVDNPSLYVGALSPSTVEGAFTGYRPTAGWGTPVGQGYIYGELVLVDDGSATADEGCGTLINDADLAGKIAVARRGSCNFTIKAMNAQNAGAIGIIIVNNAGNMIDMGGNDPDVAIPAIMITQAQGNNIIAELAAGETVIAMIGNQNEYIESLSIDSQVANTGNNNGYLSSEFQFSVTKGNTVPFTLTPGYDGTPLPYAAQIWMDLNQDGIFDESELLFDLDENTTSAVSGEITIPSAAETGITGMRVIMAYQGIGSGDFPGVCDSFTSGEVEDYCINILSDEICNIAVAVENTNPSCSNIANGEISLIFDENDMENYAFNWSNGAGNTPVNTGLISGNYTVVITNENQCDTTIQVLLEQDNQLVINTSNLQNASCESNADGAITVEAQGNGNFTYTWVSGQTGASIDNLTPGTYIVTATADNGCSAQTSFVITAETVLNIQASINDPSCPDLTDGSLTATATGGDNITYEWTNGPATANWNGIGNGTYEVTATAENGCSITASFELVSNPVSPVSDFNATPNGLTVNFVNASSGASSYSWDFGDGNTANSVNATHTYAEAGTYTVCLNAVGTCETSQWCQTVNVSVNNVYENANDLGIKVYPNPATAIINFYIPVPEAQSISLMDATGKQVKSIAIKSSNEPVKIDGFANGIYLYVIKDGLGNTIHSSKISIQQ